MPNSITNITLIKLLRNTLLTGFLLLLSLVANSSEFGGGTVTIKGLVELPTGQVAPPGGISLSVRTRKSPSGPGGVAEVNIPEGTASMNYEIEAAAGYFSLEGIGFWTVEYSCNSCQNYISRGYYGSSGTVTSWELSTHLAGTSNSITHLGINLQLLTGEVKISGEVSLPAAEISPAEGILVNLVASANSSIQHQTDTYLSQVIIPSGQNKVQYSISLPLSTPKGWRVGVRSLICNDCEEYSDGYYHRVHGTTSYRQATPLTDTNHVSGIDLDITKSIVLSGRVSLPPPDVAPSPGVTVYLYAPGHWRKPLTILEGQSYVDYSIYLSRFNQPYRVGALFNTGGYGRRAYYSTEGTLFDPNRIGYRVSRSSPGLGLLAGGADQTNINIELIRTGVVGD